MLAGLLAVLAVLTVRERFDDPDMWWHLKTGQIVWTTHSAPTTDLYSYTTGHHADIPHEWLAETFIYGAYRLGGYSYYGLMLWLFALTSAVLIAGYGFCWLYSKNAKVAFVGALTIWLGATIGLAVRPQMVGYLLMIVEFFFLYLGKTRNRLWFLGLPPLFAIWVNCHGSFAAGLIIAGCILLCSFVNLELPLVISTRWTPANRRLLALAFVLSIGALFLNPVGVKLVMYPFEAMRHMSTQISVVSEWQPLAFTDVRTFALLGIVVMIPVLAAAQRKKLYLHELLLLALGVWQAASHQRLLFLFGILAAPTLTRVLSDSWEGYEPREDRPGLNFLMIAGSIAIIVLSLPNNANLKKQVEDHSPAKAVEFLKTHPQISGNMLNEYVYGGYLIWAAPEHPVFVDGRGDVFNTVGVLGDYGNWAMLESDPAELLNKYKIDFCLLSRESPMVRVLPLMHWKTIYSDENSVILVRGDGADSRER